MTGQNKTPDNWKYLSHLSLNYLGWTFCWTIATSYMAPNTLLKIVDPSIKNIRLGLMSGAANLFLLLMIPLVGTMSDRMRSGFGKRRPFYMSGVVMMAACVFMISGCRVYLFLLALMVLMHGSLSMWYPNRALIRDVVPLRKRGRISGLSNITNTLGMMFAHVVSPILIRDGRMMLLGIIAVAGNLTANAWVALRIKEDSKSDPPPQRISSWREIYLPRLDGSSKLGRLAAFNLFTQMGVVAMVCFLLYFIKDQIDPVKFNETFAKVILIAMGAAVPSSLGAGVIADRFGRKRILVVACLLQVGCMLNFLFSPRMHATLYLSGLLYGLGNGAYLSVYWAIVSDMVPEGETSKYVGLIQYTSIIPWAIVPPTLGFIVDKFGASSGRGYTVQFSVIVVLLMIGVILISKIPETLKKSPPDEAFGESGHTPNA